jgi:AraC-like DNA-binding protein
MKMTRLQDIVGVTTTLETLQSEMHARQLGEPGNEALAELRKENEVSIQLARSALVITAFYQQAADRFHLSESGAQVKRMKLVAEIYKEVCEAPNIACNTALYFAVKHKVSEATIRKNFKDFFTISLHQFVTLSCIQKAYHLRMEQGLSLDEIAAALGYADRSGFLKALKRYSSKPD